MKKVLTFINHRNFILVAALITGALLGDKTKGLSSVSVYILGIVMIFATSDFSFSVFRNVQLTLKTLVYTFLLNYVVFGGLLLLMSALLFPDSGLWLGCLLLAASPPGPSVVPFSAMLKGNVSFSVLGLFGLHLLALLITPLMVFLFTGNSEIPFTSILLILLKTVIAPLILSRPLRHKGVCNQVARIKGKVINWGFFLIVVSIVGQSMSVMLVNPLLIWKSLLLLVILMFGGAFCYNYIAQRLRLPLSDTVSSTFFLTTKSSAFAAVIVFTVADKTAGIPAAVHAVLVTLFFIIYSVILPQFSRKI